MVNSVLFWLILLLAVIAGLFLTGAFRFCLHASLRFFHHEHKKFRRHQRPYRIFLIRHGQSQANVDTSKRIAFSRQSKMS